MNLEVPWSLCFMNVCCQLLGRSLSQSLSLGSCGSGWHLDDAEGEEHHGVWFSLPLCSRRGAATVHPGTYCWSFLIFLPSSGPGLGEPNRGQDPRCPGEAHHGVNIHSSTRRAAAWLGWKRSSSGSKGHAVQAQSSSGLGLWKTAVLCCKLLGKNRCRNSRTQRMPSWILSNRKE